jgi:hypothetical protein
MNKQDRADIAMILILGIIVLSMAIAGMYC